MTEHAVTFAELLKNGDFSFRIEDDTHTAVLTYTESFKEWFRETYGKELTESELSRWFQALLKESLDYYKNKNPLVN